MSSTSSIAVLLFLQFNFTFEVSFDFVDFSLRMFNVSLNPTFHYQKCCLYEKRFPVLPVQAFKYQLSFRKKKHNRFLTTTLSNKVVIKNTQLFWKTAIHRRVQCQKTGKVVTLLWRFVILTIWNLSKYENSF